MIVQAINAGTTVVQSDQFNLLVPGARVGDGSGCTAQWGSTNNWGSLNDGIYDRNGCNNLPDKLKGGCNWYFDWFKVRCYKHPKQPISSPSLTVIRVPITHR